MDRIGQGGNANGIERVLFGQDPALDQQNAQLFHQDTHETGGKQAERS